VLQLRRLQGLLQTDGAEGPVVRLPGGEELHHRQEAEEPVSVLPLPKMPEHGHEAGGRAGGAPEDEGQGHVGGGVDVEHAGRDAPRQDNRGGETDRMQRPAGGSGGVGGGALARSSRLLLTHLLLQSNTTVNNICQATNKQLFQLVQWAKLIPHFTSLPMSDQVLLLRAGWNELLIAAFSHRSIQAQDAIVLATGLTVNK
jgi:hypothetical protein